MTDYVDANVLVFALIDGGPAGDACRRRLAQIDHPAGDAVTSALTMDEVAWALVKRIDRATALKMVRGYLKMPGLSILPATSAELDLALKLMEDHPLKPRDALHAATALRHGTDSFVTFDSDFADIESLDVGPP